MIKISNNSLVKHKVSILRDKNTDASVFRSCTEELTNLLAYDLFADIELKNYNLMTPLGEFVGKKIDVEITFVPILRAGLSMLNPMTKLIPNSSIGYVGVARNEVDLSISEYLFNYPNVKNDKKNYCIILEPIIATGNSLTHILGKLSNINIDKIKVVSILASKSNLDILSKRFKDVDFFVAEVEDKLDENGYLFPGIGDAGDRFNKS